MNLSEFHLSCLKIDFLFCSMLMSSKCKIYRLSKTVNGLDINRQDVHKIYQLITSCHVKLLSDYFLTYFITDFCFNDCLLNRRYKGCVVFFFCLHEMVSDITRVQSHNNCYSILIENNNCDNEFHYFEKTTTYIFSFELINFFLIYFPFQIPHINVTCLEYN